ncbi:MAG: hypothetical protein QF415_05565 [Candidatus Undinarchaeales archaeon]|jgi:hypothetical protein|nr:hypothetical protein [Candidatus Undinarchaeales archaeon]MDP7491942.1 hypothetical protein [Candidatus Undinarchaeales archaeon]
MGRKDALDVLSKAIAAFDATAKRIPAGIDDSDQYELRRNLEVVRQGSQTLENLGVELLSRPVAFDPVIDAALEVLDRLKDTRWDELKTERQRSFLQDLAHFVGTVRGEIVNIEAALESRREKATPKLRKEKTYS